MSEVVDRVREFAWQDQDFKFLAELLHDKTGIVLTGRKKEMMYGRLVRRLRALKLDSFAAYCRYLQGPSGDRELGLTLNAITTNTTSFFREMHHFDYLRDEILFPVGKWIAADPGHHFRIWSAGCSSGEEPYSIAMVMRSIFGTSAKNSKILATDIDSNMLSTAKAGLYDSKKCRDTIPANYFKSCCRKGGDTGESMVEMSDEVKKLISFRHLNLLHDWPMKGKFDAIFCRNVMIYFDKETRDRLVRRYAGYLKENGILFVGHSESLLSVSDIYQCQGKTIYRLLS